mmetsp:Transcript_20598/g.30230  ORF Transcript_20598/g.30230 Transcript_20598/m.30230 type:complete len:81 (+) Transcript_20598:309-551(+)
MIHHFRNNKIEGEIVRKLLQVFCNSAPLFNGRTAFVNAEVRQGNSVMALIDTKLVSGYSSLYGRLRMHGTGFFSQVFIQP